MFLFLPASLLFLLSTRPMGGQPKSEASSLSSAEVRRLWEEPTEEIGLKSDSVGIHATCGAEDVNVSHRFKPTRRDTRRRSAQLHQSPQPSLGWNRSDN